MFSDIAAVAAYKESKEEAFKTSPANESVELKVPDEVVVHATEIFDGSPTGMMTQADADFSEGIVFGQNHFKGK